jgi:hypothetical protein
VQVDAHCANVAFTRPVRVSEVRLAVSGGLGTRDSAAHAGIPVRSSGTKHIGNGSRIEDSMFVATTLAVLVLLNLILSMVSCPGLARRGA